MDQDHSEMRKRLLEAGLQVFAEKGFQAVELETIASHAGMEKSHARALFLDKEGLFKAILEEKTGPLVSAASVSVSEINDPIELMRKSLWLFDQWLFENPLYVKLFKRCLLENPEILITLFKNTMFPSEYFEKLENMVADGRIRKINIPFFLILLDSMVLFMHLIGPAVERLTPNQSVEELLKQRFDTMMDILEHGIINTSPE